MPKVASLESYSFNGRFRAYQQRVLDRMDQLREDGRIHIVAAPGSGKTILGLEMICRLGAPALVVAPTIAIRDQWVARFIENFVALDFNHSHAKSSPFAPVEVEVSAAESSSEAIPSVLCSTDLFSPKAITVITYQSFYSAFTRGLDDDTGINFADLDLVAALRNAGITTIVLDEAHHLRAQWHRALVSVLEELPELTVISLTATPPYDATLRAWEKYLQLCGPIDEEISSPELVATGDLCPHQDYIYVTSPTAAETEKIQALRACSDAALATVIEAGFLPTIHRELCHSLASDEAFHEALDDETSLMELVALFESQGISTPEILASFLDSSRVRRPNINALQFVISHPGLFSITTHNQLCEVLRQLGILRNEKIISGQEEEINRILNSSASILGAAADITQAEIAALGAKLRLVILADHIRADYLNAVGTDIPLTHLGVIPIFEEIRRRLGKASNIAVLTGSVVLVPEVKKAELAIIANEFQEELKVDKSVGAGFCQISFASGNPGAVRCLTKAFEDGVITVLIGTAALLGEGWDAPHANAVILATRIRAFMLSNQMRGRVIRSAGDPHKTANIWHIASCEPDNSRWFNRQLKKDDSQRVLYSHDMSALIARFNTFIAPHAVEPRIESGIERCFDTEIAQAYRNIESANAKMLQRARNREAMAQQWWQALGTAGAIQSPAFQTLVRVDPLPVMKPKIINYWEVLACFLLALVFFLGRILCDIGKVSHISQLALLGMGIMFLALAGLRWERLRKILDPTQRWRRQARALLNALRQVQLITDRDLAVQVDDNGVSVVGGTVAQRLLYVQALTQLFEPITNPRYLIIWENKYWLSRFFCAQAVPDILGTKREYVDIFVESLHREGILMKAKYLRTSQGRKLLVKARRLAAQNIASNVVRKYRRVMSG